MLTRAAEQHADCGVLMDVHHRMDSAAGTAEVDVVFLDDAWHETASIESIEL
jgi:hypothetical protein